MYTYVFQEQINFYVHNIKNNTYNEQINVKDFIKSNNFFKL